ncbi:unnamed protein product, partial [Gulo gulo]
IQKYLCWDEPACSLPGPWLRRVPAKKKKTKPKPTNDMRNQKGKGAGDLEGIRGNSTTGNPDTTAPPRPRVGTGRTCQKPGRGPSVPALLKLVLAFRRGDSGTFRACPGLSAPGLKLIPLQIKQERGPALAPTRTQAQAGSA